jgi:HEPN domain-containing protein
MEEVDRWFKKAKDDLASAKINLREGLFEVAAFLAHQAAEKALKSLYILKRRELWKTHDLVKLAESVGGSDAVRETCKKLNPHYLATRYPLEVAYTEEKANEAINAGEEVLEWVKKNLSG